MIDIHELLAFLWKDYLAITPQAARVHTVLEARGEIIVNDHIALRTFDLPAVGIEVLARPFLACGYEPRDDYEFPDKKLVARYYQHADPALPKVFVSELEVGKCSPLLQRIVAELVGAAGAGAPDRPIRQDGPDWPDGPPLVTAGRPWPLSFATYEQLLGESEYAAWVAAFGFRANHFTVDTGALRTFASLSELNELLLASGFELNASGGLIKGSPADLLEQSSTLADEVEVAFTGERHRIRSCYYEFARRYPGESGELFHGFIATSADKIFESTDIRR